MALCCSASGANDVVFELGGVCGEICLSRDEAQLARYQAGFAKDWVALYRQILR